MRIVVIDVETTSLEPSSRDGVVHIGAVEIETDQLDTTGDAFQAVCKPVFERGLIENAWIFKNGELTIDQVMDAPYHSEVAVQFINWLDGRPWTAYNLEFERKFLCRGPWNLRQPDLRCIMLAATPVCKLPGLHDYDIDYPDAETYKWPKLREAWRCLIGTPYPRVWHSALQDADAAARILLKLLESNNYQIA